MLFGSLRKRIQWTPSFLSPLIYRLSQEGFDLEFLSRLFSDARAEFLPGMTTISLYSNEAPERYAQFLSPELILLSKQFLDHNFKTLREMEKRFQVDKEVAVAILLVGIKIWGNIGRYRVLPTLASISLMASAENLRKNCDAFRNSNPEASCDWDRESVKKEGWMGFQELKCFLNIVRQRRSILWRSSDPMRGYGAWLNSCLLVISFALTEESLEKWLLSKEEAIFSIGNYLKCHGWKKNLPAEKEKANSLVLQPKWTLCGNRLSNS